MHNVKDTITSVTQSYNKIRESRLGVTKHLEINNNDHLLSIPMYCVGKSSNPIHDSPFLIRSNYKLINKI